MVKKTTLIIVGLFSLCLFGCKAKSGSSSASSNKTISNTFEIITQIKFQEPFISINTDLPDSTEIHLAVSRIYEEKNNGNNRKISYFSKNTTVGKWKELKKVDINNKKWKSKLYKRYEKSNETGISDKVRSVSQFIIVTAKIIPNQFGENNSNLSGKAIYGSKVNRVDDRAKLYYMINLFASPQRDKERELTAREKRFNSLVEKFEKTIAKRIMNEKIWIGMNQAMAIESIGRPYDINKTVTSYGTREQWVYSGSKYLYFVNGELTSWQDW